MPARSRRRLAALLVPMLALACGDRTPPPAVDLAITNVNVIPMDSARVLPDQTVLIDGDSIVVIGPAVDVDVTGAVRVIDASGGYLVPGLADMHVHIGSENDLVPYVAYGVTLVRNMWGQQMHLDLRSRVESGELLGPTIVTAGPLIDGDPPVWDGSAVAATPDEGRRLVAQQKDAGYDFIKVYGRLSTETLEAIVAEASALGIPVAGHVPAAVPLARALELGMASVEHLSGFRQATLSSPDALPADNKELASVARALESGETALDEVFDADALADIVDLAASGGTWQVPTLIVLKRIRTSRRQAEELMSRPELRFMPPVALASWNPDTDFRLQALTDDDLEALQFFFGRQLERVRALHEAGVRILAGSDAPNPHVVHGYSLHEELNLLHEAGLSNYDVLVTTTVGPAEFLGLAAERGTVAVGKGADLVLVSDNPLDDLGTLVSPVGVVLHGEWWPRAMLDSALNEVAAAYATPSDWFAGVDEVALPVEADATGAYRFRFNGIEVGAVRSAHGARAGGGRVFTAQGVFEYGERSRVDCTIEHGEGGDFASAACTQIDPRGDHRIELRVAANTVILSGARGNGDAISDEADVDGPALVVTGPLVPGLYAIANRYGDLAPGATEATSVVVLDTQGGGFDLVTESWSLQRRPDRDEMRVLVAVVDSPIGDYSIELEIDPQTMSVVRATFTYQMGIVTVEAM